MLDDKLSARMNTYNKFIILSTYLPSYKKKCDSNTRLKV